MKFPWFKLDPNERLAAPILVRELGVLGALRIGRAIRRLERTGAPFAELPAAESEQERLSREQIGPAILLYLVLRERFDQARALAITEEIVVEAACVFLRQSIGSLRRAELEALDEDGKQAFVKERGERFFNATVTWDEIGTERVRFTVTHCRFPPLCAAAGVPELAPVFCKGDARFFGTVEPDVELIRPHTIAGGATTCPFTLQWATRTAPSTSATDHPTASEG